MHDGIIFLFLPPSYKLSMNHYKGQRKIDEACSRNKQFSTRKVNTIFDTNGIETDFRLDTQVREEGSRKIDRDISDVFPGALPHGKFHDLL